MDFSRHPLFGWLRELRRELHRRPETAFNEIETSRRGRRNRPRALWGCWAESRAGRSWA